MKEIFGTVLPKPVYRTATGKFRKETKQEFRDRHDETAWRHLMLQRKMQREVFGRVANTNPYATLATVTTAPVPVAQEKKIEVYQHIPESNLAGRVAEVLARRARPSLWSRILRFFRR